MKFYIFESGSKGNCTLITNDNHYKVDFIKDIKNVEKTINELINKYKKFKL